MLNMCAISDPAASKLYFMIQQPNQRIFAVFALHQRVRWKTQVGGMKFEPVVWLSRVCHAAGCRVFFR
jgi:hypothetical protein